MNGEGEAACWEGVVALGVLVELSQVEVIEGVEVGRCLRLELVLRVLEPRSSLVAA